MHICLKNKGKEWRIIHFPETLKQTKRGKIREHKIKAPLTSGMSSHKADWNFSKTRLS